MLIRTVDDYSKELRDAEQQRVQIEPLTGCEPSITLADAYAIQNNGMARKLANGNVHLGWKIGLTSKPIQQMLGVSEPDFGRLLSSMYVYEFDTVQLASLIQPRAEGEIAFVLETDLAKDFVTEADVLRATSFVVPCIEIIDSRIQDWKIAIQDTVADNASSGLFVHGGKRSSVEGLDLKTLGMVVEKNEEVHATGAGAAALGNPVKSVAWLANTLRSFGQSLAAGDIILSGGLAATVTPTTGDVIRVSIQRLGSVTVRFV